MSELAISKKSLGGFPKPFWVANIMELFERLAYYGQGAILSLFLRNHLKFDEAQVGDLSSIFGGLIYLLPIFAGAIADKIGFKKAFSIAFFVLSIGYFLIGAAGIPAFQGLYTTLGLYNTLVIVLVFTAMGGSFIKPSVLGTVAFTTTHENKSSGYAIYYWLVNIGAAIGPNLAFMVRGYFGISFVYIVSAISCALMLVTTLLFFNEPSGEENRPVRTIGSIFSDMKNVLLNFKFMALLMIYALYWILFWQEFIIIPFYVDDFISHTAPVETLISIGALTIIIFQIPINLLTKRLKTTTAIIIGFVLAAVCWMLPYFLLPVFGNSSVSVFGTEIHAGLIIIGAAIFTFSIGEQIQAPRFYEYIADIAPKGQEALFQGFAFLPIAIAWAFGGKLGGSFYKHFVKEQNNPSAIFFIMICIGILAVVLISIFAKVTNSKKTEQ